MSDMAGYAFISYSSKNQQMADSVRALLKDNHIACWMAPYDIPAGSKYAHVINDALENCSCLVLLLTEAAQQSQFVEREIERAVTYRKPIIPLMLEQVVLNSGFRFLIGESQIIALHEIDPDVPAVKRALGGIRNFTEQVDADDVDMGNVSHAANLVEAGAVNVNGTGAGNVVGGSVGNPAGGGTGSAAGMGRSVGAGDRGGPQALDDAQTKKGGSIGKKIKSGLWMLPGILVFLFPFIIINTYSDSWPLPEPLKAWLAQIARMSHTEVCLVYSAAIVISIIIFIHDARITLDYRRRRCGAENLTEEEFDGKPELLVNRIVELCSGQCIKTEKSERECAEEDGREKDSCQYAYQKSLRGMEVASVSGERADYFLLRYREYAPEFSVFLIGKYYTKNEAATILTKQGFFFSEEKDHIVHFYRDDLHVRIGFSAWGFNLIGLELCRGDIPSRMSEIVAEEIKDSLDTMFQETKKDFGKMKQEWKDDFRKMKQEFKEEVNGSLSGEDEASREECADKDIDEEALSGGEQSESGTAGKEAPVPRDRAETEEKAVPREETAPKSAEQ